MSTKMTEGLAVDIAECAKVEDAARGRFDAAVAELAAAKAALNSARLATGEAIERWRLSFKHERPVDVSAAPLNKGRPGTISVWTLEALERQPDRSFIAEEIVDLIKDSGHKIDLVSMRTALGRLVAKRRIQRTGRGLYRANAGSS